MNIPTTAFQIFPKGHYRATVHGDVTHAPSESFFLKFQLLIIFTTVRMILQVLTLIRILNSLMFPNEVRPGFHNFYNFLRQTQIEQCYTFINSCPPLFPQVLIIRLEFMMTKKVKKKNS